MSSGLRPLPTESKNSLIQVASNIWTIEAEGFVYFRPPAQPRYPYPHRAVVIRLKSNTLFIHSPIALTPTIKQAVDALGTVKYLVSPNPIHHLHLGEWSDTYPEAVLYASPGLIAKRKDLTFKKTLLTDSPEPEWEGQIHQSLFKSWNGWFDELVFFHCESRTVVLTDMVMDFNPSTFSALSQRTTQWNLMYRHTPRTIQYVHAFGRDQLRRVLAKIRGWEPEHLIVAHSPWQCVDDKQQVSDFLDVAFDWLAPRPKSIETILAVSRFSTLAFVLLPIHAFLVLTADIIYPRLKHMGSDS